MRRSGRCPSWGHAPRWAPGDCESERDVYGPGSCTPAAAETDFEMPSSNGLNPGLTRIGGRELPAGGGSLRGKHARRPLLPVPLPPRHSHRLLRLLLHCGANGAAGGSRTTSDGWVRHPALPAIRATNRRPAPPPPPRRARARPPLSRSRPPRLTCEPHHHPTHTHAPFPRISLDRTRRPRTVRSRTRRTIAGYISWSPLALAPLSLTSPARLLGFCWAHVT